LDEVMRAENERLTEERNALQQSIKQLEQKIGSHEPSQTRADVDADLVSAAGLVLYRRDHAVDGVFHWVCLSVCLSCTHVHCLVV